jgi:2-aminoadipate transaminase
VLQLPGAVAVPIPVDERGLQVDVLADRLRAGFRPRAVYVVPDFHNPTGATLSAERRVALTELAERYGFLLVSDNPYKWLRGTGDPIPDLDVTSRQVIRSNTFSKVFGPGLRVGWTVLPETLVKPALEVRSRLDQHASSLTQEALAELVSSPGYFASVTARAGELYRERGAVWIAALRERLGDRVDVTTPEGGLFSWPRFRELPDTTAFATNLLAAGVSVVPGSQFEAASGSGAAAHLRASFGQQPEDRLRQAAEIFGRVYDETVGRGRR